MMFTPNWRFSPSGLHIGPASGQTEKQRSSLATLSRTLPVEAECYMSEPAQIYLHWLFALMDPEINRIDGTFAGTVLMSLELFEKNWKLLANDIRHGTLSAEKVGILSEVAEKIRKGGLLRKDPERAEEIEKQCSKGMQGIVSRLWPRIQLLSCLTTGAHAIYKERVQWYVGENVQLFSPYYGASEGAFGWNMDIDCENGIYTLLPTSTFLEFIPESEIAKENPTTLFIDQVLPNRRYELVTTNTVGFYRYRMGDLIEVVKFHNSTPVIKFIGRVGSILDLRGEKTSEDMILEALNRSVPHWGNHKLVDYTTSESVSLAKASGTRTTTGLYYVLFVELDGKPTTLTEEEIKVFDEHLSEISYPYKSFRVKESIAFPQVLFSSQLIEII